MISDKHRVYFQLFVVASMVFTIGVGAYRIGFYEGLDSMCAGTLVMDENENISCFLGNLSSGYDFSFSLPVNMSEVVVS